MDKLQLILNHELFEYPDTMGDAILQDLLEVLISRNETDDGFWTEYISKIQTIQAH